MRIRSCVFPRAGVIAGAILLLAFSVSNLLADSFDWRNIGGTCWINNTVQDQGGTGVCYAFALNAVMESKYMVTRNDPNFIPDLSEQQWFCEEVTVGRKGLAYITDHGIVSEAELPWTGSYPTPGWPLATGWGNRVWKATGIAVSPGNTIDAVKAQLKALGPFMVGIGEFYDPPTSTGAHTVAVIGYQDDAAAPGGGYWIVKNSWGASWNGDGYGAISYASAPLVNKSDVYLNAPVYYSGSMATASWSGGAGTWMAGDSTKWSGYTWQNQETSASFAGTGGNVTLSGTVIAHAVNINSTGYTFSGGALTVTAGGIAVNESTTISSPLTIGGPQTWSVASGKSLNATGALHTIISNVTIAGSGNVTLSGGIDGGGIANMYGAKPGGIIKNSTGTLTLSGASNFGGDITVNTGTLTISPAANATYSGAFLGSGSLSLAPTSAATISIGGGNSNFTGPISLGTNATLSFMPLSGVVGSFTGAITGTSRPVIHNNVGTTILTNVSGRNTYSGTTTLNFGVLQADSGYGLPAASKLIFNGGVIQSNGTSTVTFSRTLSNSSGNNYFYWANGGGGFSAGTVDMNVKVNNNTNTISFGNSQGSQIVGSLLLSSNTAAKVTTFMNGLNLNGSDRTISVDDNPATTADYAVVSNVINNSTGTAGLYKNGAGLLRITGANTYNGKTYVTGGVLQADLIGFDGKTTGIPSASNLQLNNGVFMPYTTTATFTRAMGTGGGQVQLNGGGFAANASNYNVNIGGNATPSTLSFGATAGTNITGVLMLNSVMSTSTVTFQNGLNLNGGARTINVLDNPASTTDGAILTNVISGAAGSSLTKTGAGKLTLSGTAANTYSGTTTLVAGNMDLNKSANVVALPGDLTFANADGNWCFVRTLAAGQIPATSKLNWTFNTSTNNPGIIELMGNNLTVAGISCPWYMGFIENTQTETGYGNSILTVNNATDCAYYGWIRNSVSGSGTLGLTKQGAGTLTLVGTAYSGWGNLSYTGPTLVSAGKLVIQDGVNSFGSAITNNAALELRASTVDFTFSPPIGGTGSFTKTGPCALVFTGSSPNTYSGTTTLSEGAMYLSKSPGVYSIPGDIIISAAPNTATWLVNRADGQMPATTNMNFQCTSSSYSFFLLNGYSTQVASISGSSENSVIENTQDSIAAPCTFTVNNSNDCAFNGYIRDSRTGSGSLAFVKTGSGALTLGGSGPISYTGGTTVSQGLLVLQKTAGYAVPGDLTVDGPGIVCVLAQNQIAPTGSLTFSGTQNGGLLLYGNSVTLANLNSTSGGFVGNTISVPGMGNGTLIVNNTSDNYYNGTIYDNNSGSGTVALTKTGEGRLFLGGSSGNTNTGLTTVSQGLLVLQKTSGYAISGNIAIDSGALCVVNPNQIVPTAAVSFTGAQVGALLLYGNTVTVTSLSSTSGGNVGNTAGAVGPGNGTLVVNNASNCSYYGAIYNNVAGGTGLTAVTKNGAGTLYLYGNAANDFTGGLTINAGMVDFENTENDVAHPYTVNPGGHLVLNGTQLAAAASAMSLIAASETDDYANAVPDTNNGTMSIVGSTYFNARNLVGTGTLMVKDDAVVYAHSLVQDTLVIGGTSSYSPAVAVPEPGTMMLLAFAALALAGIGIGRKNRG